MRSIKTAIHQRITFRQSIPNLRMVMAAVIVFTICTFVTLSLHADNLQSEPSQRPTKESIVIKKKSQTHIEDTAYRQYQVSKRTLIMGADGKQVKYSDMAVPCEAEVHYRLENGNRNLLLVKITLIKPGAESAFPTAVAE